METNWGERTIDCPHCFDGTISNGNCGACGESIRIRSGIPSVARRDTGDESAGKLATLAKAGDEPLEDVINQVRDDYMDGSVVDRFFKTRTVNWRVLVAPHLSGRGLLFGDHEPKVGILLSELLNEVYSVDSSLVRLQAQTAIANACGTSVKPLHGDIGELPFPADSFDLIAIDCRAHEIGEYLSQAKPYIAPGGRVLLLVDGWPRESGITDVAGLGEPPSGLSERAHASLYGHSFGIQRLARNEGFTVSEGYALLSTNRHENERLFHVESQAALDWLLQGPSKTAKASPFFFARMLSKSVRKAGIIQQCYPRYLFVCQPEGGEECNRQQNLTESILISGKNRSTLLQFDKGVIEQIRKVPNSRRQATLNENAGTVTEAVTGMAAQTVPQGELVETKFGAERHEKPIAGPPLDQTLEPTPESVGYHLGIVFDWLADFQTANTVKWVQKDPATIERELTNETVGLSSPPPVEQSIGTPLVISHGDFFGSNIYLEDDQMKYVIDWEWAELEANPIIDAGFFVLQLAEFIGNDFVDGFNTVFADSRYAERVYPQIVEYCSTIKIEPEIFSLYFPIGYKSRMVRDMKINKRLDIDWVSRIRCVWNRQREIERRIAEWT